MTGEEAKKEIIDMANALQLIPNTPKGKAVSMAIKALEQEAVLDKIKAEIEALIEWHDCPIEYDNGNDAWYCEACNRAIKIIDKYKAESEGI